MMIWGYAMQQITEDGLMEMREVTFDGDSPDFLRKIAQFLSEMATKIESGNMRHSHVHIGEVFREWEGLYPNKDVIVSIPVDWDQLDRQLEEKRRESPGATFPLSVCSKNPMQPP